MPSARPPETVLFDLDGTLVDNFDAIATAANHVLQVMGFAPLPREVICNSVGGGALGTMARLVGKENAPTATRLYLDHFPTVMFEGLRVYPGARELIRALRARGTVVAVLTNKDHTNSLRLLAHLGMDGDLDGIFGTNAVPWRKPDPSFTRYALDKLGGRAAAGAEMVGDSPYDIATARQGGLAAARVVATGTHSLEQLAADNPDSGHPDLIALARDAWGMELG
jgi:phosphoglycolate phosphatase